MLTVVLSAVLLLTALAFFGVEWLLKLPVSADARLAMFISGGLGLIFGGLIVSRTRHAPRQFGRREAMLLVAMSWLIGAAFAAVPYFLWAHLDEAASGHPFRSFVNCYFESMSGLTTTGATILPEIGTVPDSLLLWRALTHWFGGLGIVVLFVAVLPSLGVGGKRLFRVEAPGPSQEGLQPHIRETARVLWLIYVSMTLIAILALKLTGEMDWFDSICHACSMVSTGGLSTADASIGQWDSIAVDIIIICGMLLAGVNFALFYQMTQGKLNAVWKDVEFRVYIIPKIVVIAIITVQLVALDQTTTTTTGNVAAAPGGGASVGESLRYASFTTVALQTGTGFATNDYQEWPQLTQMLLIVLMIVGGCAGSTAGGIKVIRVWIALKVLFGELEKAFRPSVVRPLKVGNSTIDAEGKQAALAYIVSILLLLSTGAILIEMFEMHQPKCDLVTAATASLSTLCNVGPGLHAVGPTTNYHWFSDPSKIVMSILMALGRLEVFAILILFVPRFWRSD